MNNYSGIVYRISAVCGPIFVLGLVLVIVAFKRPISKRKAEMFFAIAMIIISFSLGSFYAYKTINPTVLCHKGYMVEVRRYPNVPFTSAYVFSNKDGDKRIFYLDSFSKNTILVNDIQVDIEYQVFYEEDTKIIVRVEPCKDE